MVKKINSIRTAAIMLAFLITLPIFASKASKAKNAKNMVSYNFQEVSPSISAGTTTYQQQVTVSGTSGTTGTTGTEGESEGSETTGITYSIGTCVGDVKADINASTGDLSNITGNGAIQVIANSNGQQVAEYVLTVAYATHTWDFCTNPLTPTPNGRLGTEPQAIGDPNTEHKNTNNTADETYWKKNYQMTSYNSDNTIAKQTGPFFAYNNAVNGDNALIIQETAGLQFNCTKGRFGVVNHSSDPHYRNVCFGVAESFLTIPKLKKGQYIKIWWDPYAGTTTVNSAVSSGATFSATNVLDLDGNAINTKFAITGVSGDWTNGNGSLYGATCFQVDADGDVKFTLQDAGWNDIYKIEVKDSYTPDFRIATHDRPGVTTGSFNGKPISSENANNTVLAGNSIVISGFPQENNSMAAMTPQTELIEGTDLVDMSSIEFQSSKNKYYSQKITPKKGKYGYVKVRQKILSGGEKGKQYVFDKAETWLAVGDVTQQTYPYTWDFTSYNANWDKENGNAKATTLDRGNEKEYGKWTSAGLYIINKVQNEITNNEESKPIFANGSQLTISCTDGIKPIKETEGLGIILSKDRLQDKNATVNIAKAAENESATKSEYALQVDATDKIRVPQVDAGMYIFVASDQKPTLTLSTEIEGTAGATGTEGTAETEQTVSDETSTFKLQDGVYAYKVSQTGDVMISGVNQVYRIAVTNQIKEMNKDGKTTDSRAFAIDYSETAKYTKDKLTAYAIYEDADGKYLKTDGDVSTISLSEVKVADKETGVVLWNNPEEGVYSSDVSTMNIPLFVPAYNIEKKAAWTDSPLQPNVEKKQMGTSDANTKYYVYTNRFFTTSNPEYQTGKQYLFYQVNSAGTLAANKAYLKLNTANSTGAKQNILLRFMDDETTGIFYTPAADKATKQECYTLSGLKLNGDPTPGQIYIQGGKKFIAK